MPLVVSEEELTAQYILPHAFDMRVSEAVAEAVAKDAKDNGLSRL